MPSLFVALFPDGATKQDITKLSNQITQLDGKVTQLMAQVQISQEALDQFATDVSTAADELGSDIDALKQAVADAGVELPQANVDSLNASLEKLRSLDVPDTQPVEQPPAE